MTKITEEVLIGFIWWREKFHFRYQRDAGKAVDNIQRFGIVMDLLHRKFPGDEPEIRKA